MCSSWGLPASGRSWQVLLLSAHILSSCFQLTQSQADPKINITLKPPTPIAGADVTLIPGGYVEDTGICFWLRGGKEEKHRIFTYFPAPHFNQEPGPAYTGRETAGKDCSMHISNLTAEDTGNYTVFKNKLRGSDEHQEGNVYLLVLSREDARARGNLATRKPRRRSPNVVVGIVVGSIFGMALIGGLLYYRLFRLSQVATQERRRRIIHNLQPKWKERDQGTRS